MERPRVRSRRDLNPHPIGTPVGTSPNTGPLATAAWLVARGLLPKEPQWFVEVAFDLQPAATFEFDPATATRFQIELYPQEWGYRFCHAGRGSWIRITDIPFVHGVDDHGLIGLTPPLRDIGTLIRWLERTHAFVFPRDSPLLRTDGLGEAVIRDWATTL